MPIHDWTRVSAGTWHDFHQAWIAELRKTLNGGLLPPDYYAQSEQVSGRTLPDVLTLQLRDVEVSGDDGTTGGGVLTLSKTAPKAKLSEEYENNIYTKKRHRLVIRHNNNDRVAALLELVSPGNKSSRKRFAAFVNKAASCLEKGYHLLLVDLFPIGQRDQNGVHGAIMEEIENDSYRHPRNEPLTLVSYSAGLSIRAYIEPTAVGQTLTAMPLFLTTERYVNVPLEETYMAAYKGEPKKYKAILEG